MYKKIAAHKSVGSSYADFLRSEKVVNEGWEEKLRKKFVDKTEEEFKAAEGFKHSVTNTRDPKYPGSRSLTHKW